MKQANNGVSRITISVLSTLCLFWISSANADLLDILNQVNQGLSAANQVIGGKAVAAPNAVAVNAKTVDVATPSGPEQEIKVIVPTDTSTRAAIDAALPTLKEVLAIHRCVKVDDGMLRLNFYAVPGVNLGGRSYGWQYPNSEQYMKYHDRSNCVSIKVVDSWAMPALNALQLRVVYFAEDSGETVNFNYLMKKSSDDDSWKVAQIKHP